jgi:N-acetylneuraminic acid mutarotase
VNGKLYAVGGVRGNGTITNAVEAYDPATDTWTTRAPMPTTRWDLAVGVVNGILYAIGGAVGGVTNKVEAYDPATNTWTIKTPMPEPRYLLTACAVNGILYAAGGRDDDGPKYSVEAFDPARNSWSMKAGMRNARWALAAAAIHSQFYAIGGWQQHTGPLTTTEAYDGTTNT